jgi:hypothetical protein
MISMILEHINRFLYRINTQNTLWQSYISSGLFLDFNKKRIYALLILTLNEFGFVYGY